MREGVRMTALASDSTTPSPTLTTYQGRTSFVIATLALWLSSAGGQGFCLLGMAALAYPDLALLLAVCAFASFWPAVIVGLVSAATMVYAWRRRRRVTFWMSVSALVCHLPLGIVLVVLQPLERFGAR